MTEYAQDTRLQSAAARAKKLWPGPVGELISRELLAFVDFGAAFGKESLVMAAANEILNGGDRVFAAAKQEDQGSGR